MNSNDIRNIVDNSFQSAFSSWEKQIEQELYPDAFADPHSWLRVKSALVKNNNVLKEAIIQVLDELLVKR